MLRMNTTTLILFVAFLVVGLSSIGLLGYMYVTLIYKHKKIDVIFNFSEYANRKETTLIKIGSIGLVISVLLFILL